MRVHLTAFSYFMIETVLIGKLSKINPFDQPAVEQVKYTRGKILIKSTKYYFRSTIILCNYI